MGSRIWWLGMAGAVLGACSGEQPRDTLPNIGDDDDTTTDTDPTQPVLAPFRLSITPGLDYPMRLRETGTADGRCEVTPPTSFQDHVDIDCTIDMNELDLYGNGLDWDLTVPAGACDYLVYWHYQYEAWQVGTGPTEVSYTILPGGGFANEVNSINGQPYCVYDHGWRYLGAPNCCLGSYTKTVTDPFGNVTVSNEFWAGQPSTCYGGAAFIDPEVSLDEAGWPRAKIVYLNGDAYSKSFHFEPLSATFYSNVPLANYYSPQDHNGDRPAGLAGLWAAPRYTFQCVDRDFEVFAEIRMVVREFNEEAQYDADGNPDTVGVEPATGHPIDDLADWSTATPGDDVFIEFFE